MSAILDFWRPSSNDNYEFLTLYSIYDKDYLYQFWSFYDLYLTGGTVWKKNRHTKKSGHFPSKIFPLNFCLWPVYLCATKFHSYLHLFLRSCSSNLQRNLVIKTFRFIPQIQCVHQQTSNSTDIEHCLSNISWGYAVLEDHLNVLYPAICCVVSKMAVEILTSHTMMIGWNYTRW